MDSIKLQIPSLPENVRIVESFIDNAKDRFNIDDDVYGNIMVAVTESVNNAIIHGNNCDKSKNVNISLEMSNSELRFVIEDEGRGFDYNNLPDPTAPENLLKTGGRGIFLMQNLCDKVEFDNEGRRVALSFSL
ncbi:MAG: ATP-binding protein [Cytophagales bacterium]